MITTHQTIVAAAGLLALMSATAPALADEALQRCLVARADAVDFSGVISASKGGHPLAYLARGRLAGENSPAITERARFNLGSASKMFTAVAVGQLIDAGKIRLDDRVGKFVTGLTPEASAVTIRQLLTHSSGLGNFFKPENMEAMIAARTASDILPLIADETPAFRPGSKFEYSNSGFALLGVLIERVSGQSYGDYLQAHIFAPAGMAATGLDPKPIATLAVGMTAMRPGMGPPGGGPGGPGLVLIGPDGKRLPPASGPAPSGSAPVLRRGPGPGGPSMGPGPSGPLHPAPGSTEGYGSPAGGLFSTAGDMQRFAAAFLEHRLTSASTATALTSPQIVSAPASATQAQRHYGFGFGVGEERGQPWFGHNGGTLGANTEFAVFPKQQLTLSVLSNRDPPMASTLFAYLRTLVLDPELRSSCGAK